MVTLALSLAAAAADPGALAKAAEAARRFGLRPVQPPTPAVDFELPGVDGQARRLSDFRDDWVLLTFFATWCGPCASEMPTLETLARSHPQGFTVLGVALESDRDAVAAWLRQRGATFPALLDVQGRVGSSWRAGSIPVSFLVAPGGQVVAVARGARDWSQASAMISQLLGAAPAAAADAYADAGQVELPAALQPPTAEVILATPSPRAREPFGLDVRVRWAGTLDDYLLLPPLAQLPDGIVQRGTSARTTSAAGDAVIDYRIELEADRPGDYVLGPIELRYVPRGQSEAMSARVEGRRVAVQALTVFGLSPPALGGALASTSIAAGVVGVVARRLWKRRAVAGASASSGATRTAALRERFTAARAARLRGEVALFLSEVAALERELSGAATADVSAALEQARYGGILPPRHELDAHEHRVAKLIEAATAARRQG